MVVEAGAMTINSAIILFNDGQKTLVDGYNRDHLQGAKFVYLDSFQSSQDLVQNAKTYGMIQISAADIAI